MFLNKRIFKSLTALLLIAVFMIIPSVSAFAANTASGSTGTMNSLNGAVSTAWPITVPSSHTGDVTSVTLNLSISNGSDPFDIILTAPNGDVHVQRAVSGNNTITKFNGKIPAAGTWRVAIQTYGTVSTATGRLTVNSL